MAKFCKEINVCTKGKACTRDGADLIWKAVKKYVDKFGVDDYFKLEKTKCLGLCRYGPIVQIKDDKCNYGVHTPKDCKKIVKRHAKKKKPLKRLLISYKK